MFAYTVVSLLVLIFIFQLYTIFVIRDLFDSKCGYDQPEKEHIK